jgi:hypothetical protein
MDITTEEIIQQSIELSDGQTIDLPTVIQNVIKYLNNLESPAYKKYQQQLESLYSKLNKRAKLFNSPDAVYLLSINAKDDFTEDDIIASVNKPRYGDLLSLLEFTKYDNDRTEYESYRIYKLLAEDKIKGDVASSSSSSNTRSIYLSKYKNAEIEANCYSVSDTLVEEINKFNALQLDEYNTLIEKIKTSVDSSDKKLTSSLKDDIKRYLEQRKMPQNVEDSLNKIKNSKTIDFVIY